MQEVTEKDLEKFREFDTLFKTLESGLPHATMSDGKTYRISYEQANWPRLVEVKPKCQSNTEESSSTKTAKPTNSIMTKMIKAVKSWINT